MIKAVIFDLNGVFIQREFFSESIARDFGVKKEEFMPVLKEIMDVVRKPNAPKFYELWKPYLSRWGINMTEQEFLDYLLTAEYLVPELVEFAKALKQKGLQVYIFSNNFKERTDYYLKKWPELFAIFDEVFFSWQTGFVKSQSEAYSNLLEKTRLTGEECVYFDDAEKNIELAQSLGIKAQKYDGLEGVKKFLAYV